MKMNKQIISNPNNRARARRKNNKVKNHNYLILFHKIGIAGMSRQDATETIETYRETIEENLAGINDLTINNIIVGTSENNDIDITVVYPNVEDILNKMEGYLTISQERKLKIFKLLDEKK